MKLSNLCQPVRHGFGFLFSAERGVTLLKFFVLRTAVNHKEDLRSEDISPDERKL